MLFFCLSILLLLLINTIQPAAMEANINPNLDNTDKENENAFVTAPSIEANCTNSSPAEGNVTPSCGDFSVENGTVELLTNSSSPSGNKIESANTNAKPIDCTSCMMLHENAGMKTYNFSQVLSKDFYQLCDHLTGEEKTKCRNRVDL